MALYTLSGKPFVADHIGLNHQADFGQLSLKGEKNMQVIPIPPIMITLIGAALGGAIFGLTIAVAVASKAEEKWGAVLTISIIAVVVAIGFDIAVGGVIRTSLADLAGAIVKSLIPG